MTYWYYLQSFHSIQEFVSRVSGGNWTLFFPPVNKIPHLLPLNTAGRRLNHLQVLVSCQRSNVKNWLNIREQVNIAHLMLEIIFMWGKRNLLIWQADIFLSSWGKEKKSKLERGKGLGIILTHNGLFVTAGFHNFRISLNWTLRAWTLITQLRSVWLRQLSC